MAEKIEDIEEIQPKKKKKLLIWIILAVILLALGGGGYFAYVKFLKPPPPAEQAEGEATDDKKAEKKEEKKAEKKEEKKEEKKSGEKGKDDKKPVTTLQNVITNLADPGGRRYIKLSLDFDFKDEDTAREYEAKYQAKVKDAVLTLLWSKTSEELSNVDNMLTFRKEIITRVNQIMGPGKVKEVYITDRVIQ